MSTYIKHTFCPQCGSRDNVAVYHKELHYDATCFGCGAYYTHVELLRNNMIADNETSVDRPAKSPELVQQEIEHVQQMNVRGWRERKLKLQTYQKYQCFTEEDAEGNPSWYYYPYTRLNGDIAGYKGRAAFKIDDKRPQRAYGLVRMRDTMLFGQHLFNKGGKYLILTEGEEDALSWFQTMFEQSDGKYETACCSVGYGAHNARAHISVNYDFVSSFENVLVAFDNDKAGNAAADEVLRLLKPGQGLRVKYVEYKDANDYLQNGQARRLVDLFWKAERYTPVDISTLGQLWSQFENSIEYKMIELPPEYSTLKEMLGGGFRSGQITMIGALTSVGKSTHLNNIAYHAAIRQQKKVGLLYLESSPEDIVSSFLSLHTGINLQTTDRAALNMRSLKEQFDDMVGDDDRIITVNHHGSFVTVDEMFDKIRWMAKAMECELILIDPLQAAVPSNDNGVLDTFMDRLLKIVKETNAHIIVVSHMKKPADDSPHDVSEYSLKGSSSLNQIAFNTILLSRDKNHSSPSVRNATKITLVKNRTMGSTGNAGWVRYDPSTMRVKEVPDPYENPEEDLDIILSDMVDYPEDIPQDTCPPIAEQEANSSGNQFSNNR